MPIEEGSKVKAQRQPYQPTPAEIAHHELTHIPFRDWCVHCMKGRGQSNQHRSDCKKMEGEEISNGAVTTFSIDYMFLTMDNDIVTKEEAEKTENKDKIRCPVLVGKDRQTGAMIAHKVLSKGKGNGYIVKRLIADLEELGYGGSKIILKCDQENAIVEVQREVIRRRPGITIPINSSVGDSKGNGDVESAVKRIRGQLRTMKDAIEAKLKHKFDYSDKIFDWMIIWAAGLVTRYSKKESGKSAYEEVRGKEASTPIARFGERILYMPKTEDKQQARFSSGIFLGLQRKSNEVVIGTEAGVYKARTIRRLAPDAKWDIEYIKSIVGTPEEPVPGRPGETITMGTQEDGSVVPRDDQERAQDAEVVNIPRNEAQEPMTTRRMYVRKADVDKYGATGGCNGCTGVLTGEKWPNGKTIPHSNECRDRMRNLMEGDDVGRARLQGDQERVQRQNMWQDRVKPEEVKPESTQPIPIPRPIPAPVPAAQPDADMDDQVQGKRKRDTSDDVDVAPAVSYDKATSVLGPETEVQHHAGSQPVPQDDDHDGDQDESIHSPTVTYSSDLTSSTSSSSGMSDIGAIHCDMKCWEFGADERRDISSVDVAEVFSPPRVVAMAAKMGLVPGSSMDLTTTDELGEPWNFSLARMRTKAKKQLMKEKPLLLVGCPICTMFSQMMNINKDRMDPLEYNQRLAEAKVHLQFVCELYVLQHEAGRYFIHEHPQGASSWRELCVMDTHLRTLAQKLTVHQCMYGLTSKDPGGVERPARKATTFMTNCPGMALTLNKLCDGGHQHTVLEGAKRTRMSQVYPDQLCRAIVGGLVLQKRWDSAGQYLLGTVGVCDYDEKPGPTPPEENYDAELQQAWDDVNGAELDAKKVKAARKLEMEYYFKMKAYKRVPVRQCLERTGRKPIKVMWIDHNKGDVDQPNYRSRLVAKQFNTGNDDSFFAATPPIEGLRVVFSHATTGRSRTKAVMVNDVSRAYMHAEAAPNIYVDECEEAEVEGDTEPMCWLTTKSMYGTRPAASQWQKEFTKTMLNAGFELGKSSPFIFDHRLRDILVFVHGDDFVSSGETSDLEWLRKVLEAAYPIKTTVLGGGKQQSKEARVLNRIIRWHDEVGLSYEADPRHADEIIKQSGAADLKPVTSPMVKVNNLETEDEKSKGIEEQKRKKTKDVPDADQLLNKEQTTQYRGIAARGNFLAIDRADLLYAVKECSRSMSRPTIQDWDKLIRLGRYLKYKPRVVNWYKYQSQPEHLTTYTDSDWAGCRRTRRSTSGGCIMMGGHMINMWSKTQATIALSSAEAELYATVKASAESMGIASLLKDFGIKMKTHVFGDASAALAIIARRGLGRVRHLDTSYLWVQEKAATEELIYNKVAGQHNIADLFTKALDWQTILFHTENIGSKFTEGRDAMGYQVAHLDRRPLQHVQVPGLHRNDRVWTRTDLAAKSYKSTMRGGPNWADVTRRVTMNLKSGQIISDQPAGQITRASEHANLANGPEDIITALIY